MTVSGLGRSRRARRSALAVIGVTAAAALSIATVINPRLAGAVGDKIGDGIGGIKTVAAMLAERSPGERPEGALANLKPKRRAAPHERALSKIRGPISPVYQALAGPPPAPAVVPPPEVPLYDVVAGGPPIELPPTDVTPGNGAGPPILSDIPLPGGGGDGIFSPPVVASTPDVPTVPVAPVPEPASWAMMILGFALIARFLGRGTMPHPARE